MKLQTSSSTIHTNSESLESHNFAIGDVSTIIDILRNRLYSNPIQTLTQEYLSNARDSHRESGNNNPITVTLPTKLDSCLKVRDYGVGLDKNRVRDVFVNYGISTKRSDNSQTGGFGLGAKSAWAYTDSFVVVSFYNGTKSTYVAHTGKNRNGTFELIEEVETSEPNGVEVQIPVKETDIQRFIFAVYRTTLFWDVKPELKGITGVEVPAEYTNSAYLFKKNNTILVEDSNFMRSLFNAGYNNNKLFVLIDSIPYDISKHCHYSANSRSVASIVNGGYLTFIKVGNGEIDVAASREEVSSDEANLIKIDNFAKDTVNDICDIVVEAFDKSFDNLIEYIQTYEDMHGMINFSHLPRRDDLEFKYSFAGIDFKFNLSNAFTCDYFSQIKMYNLRKKKERTFLECEDKTAILANEKVTIVIDDEGYECTDNKRKRRMRQLLTDGPDRVYLVSCESEVHEKIIACTKAILLSQLTYQKSEYRGRTSGRVKLSDEVNLRTLEAIDGGYRGQNRVESSGVETKKLSEIEDSDYFYVVVPLAREERYDSRNEKFFELVSFINEQSNTVVVKCGKRDYEKLIELDNVGEFETVVDNLAEFFPIEKNKIRSMFLRHINSVLFSLKEHRDLITCPDFTRLFKMYPATPVRSELSVSEAILTKHYPYYLEAKAEHEEISKIEEKIFQNYPLLRQQSYYQQNILREYIYYINSKSNSIHN